jgi:hypothetical protein
MYWFELDKYVLVWFELKKVVDDVVERLNSLVARLKERGFTSAVITPITALRDELRSTKPPLVPNRRMWDKYIHVVTTIEELSRVASKPGCEFVVYSMLQTVREHVREFKRVVEKTRLLERAQISMLVVLGGVYVVIKAIQDINAVNHVLIAVVAGAMLSLLFKPIATLLASIALGASLLALGPDLTSLLTGLLILVASGLYLHIILFTKTKKFNERLRQLISDIDKAITMALEPSSLKLDEVVRELVEPKRLKVDDTGVLRVVNHDELLKYKVVALIANRPPQILTAPRSNDIRPGG